MWRLCVCFSDRMAVLLAQNEQVCVCVKVRKCVCVLCACVLIVVVVVVCLLGEGRAYPEPLLQNARGTCFLCPCVEHTRVRTHPPTHPRANTNILRTSHTRITGIH